MTTTASAHWPPHVEALADQLHALLCRQPCDTPDPPTGDPRHRELDRGRARFLLVGLADTGYTLTRTTTTADCH